MKKIDKLTIFLIPIGIAINVVGGQLAILLKLPLFLDSIGTFVVGALCGGIPGALVGLGCGLINAISCQHCFLIQLSEFFLEYLPLFLQRKICFLLFGKQLLMVSSLPS